MSNAKFNVKSTVSWKWGVQIFASNRQTGRFSLGSNPALHITATAAVGEIIPANRRIQWDPGVRGEIPNRTGVIFANVKNAPYNAKGQTESQMMRQPFRMQSTHVRPIRWSISSEWDISNYQTNQYRKELDHGSWSGHDQYDNQGSVRMG